VVPQEELSSMSDDFSLLQNSVTTLNPPDLLKFSLWLIFLFYKQKDKHMDLTSKIVNSWLMRRDRAKAGKIRHSILQTKHYTLPHNSYNWSYSDIRIGTAIFNLHSMYSCTYSAVCSKIQMKDLYLHINR
jgi:hypothetical protein